jgi:NADPH:quinone reductase-like Zn-dependent oxidoreductase
VDSVGEGCMRLKPGDAVWADLGKGLFTPEGVQLGAWAEYAVADESQVGLKPASMSFTDAATMPLVGLTDVQALRMAGVPGGVRRDFVAVVTSGAGGTGTPAIQMFKAYKAARIITSSSPANMPLLKSLGATDVVDYHKGTIWDTLEENSVDVVYDNFGAPGTADAAMKALRPGGVFVFLPGKGGDISKNPKAGVKQINFGLCDASKHEDLDVLQRLADGGLKAVVSESFALQEIVKAWDAGLTGHALGKIGVNITALLSQETLVV